MQDQTSYTRIGTYVQRWARWVRAGLEAVGIKMDQEAPDSMHDCKI